MGMRLCMYSPQGCEGDEADWGGRVRPLTQAEVRARRMGGRNQITAAGRRLVDGVPWGKPFVRLAMDRELPEGEVAEAPGEDTDRERKRRRVEFREAAGETDAEAVVDAPNSMLLLTMEDLDSDGDEEEDSDFEVGEECDIESNSDGGEEWKKEGEVAEEVDGDRDPKTEG